jgi:polyphenol oxidase
MTNEKGIYLFLLVADCLPVILYDQKIQVVAMVHAGWKGVDLEIARKAVEKLQNIYGSKPKDVVVGIGPRAHKVSFIKENPAQKDDPRWKDFIDRVRPCQYGKGGFYKVDLLGFTKKQLMDAGILQRNIYVSDVDTVKDKRFFSHVREGNLAIEKQGRFACVVGIK